MLRDLRPRCGHPTVVAIRRPVEEKDVAVAAGRLVDGEPVFRPVRVLENFWGQTP